MKIITTKHEFEGTPDEFQRAGFATLFGTAENGAHDVGTEDTSNVLAAADLEDFVSTRVAPSSRKRVRQFITSVLDWEGVRAVVGPGVPGGRYVRFHRRGSAFGAFAYVHPAKTYFRLRGEEAARRTHAYARNVQRSNPHQLAIHLESSAELEEALELARMAYDEAV